MTGGSTFGTILLAAIPVTVMLVIEVVLPYWKRCRCDAASRPDDVDATARRVESDQTRRDAAFTDPDQTRRDAASTGDDVDATARRVDGERLTKRWRQDGRYYQILHQTAKSGNMASMDKLGELALVRKDFVEAFYWKLMVELRHGRPSGISARNVCRAWREAGHPERSVEGETGLFTENQAKLATAVLNLWSGRHVHTPTKAIRQMVKDGQADAILFERRFGFKGV